jgi:hypothetical protein
VVCAALKPIPAWTDGPSNVPAADTVEMAAKDAAMKNRDLIMETSRGKIIIENIT